ADELRAMLYTAVPYEAGPVAIRFPRGNVPAAPAADRFETLPIGKARLLRAGEDVALIGYGTSVEWCQRAADLLAADGILPTVVNARFAKPLDAELLLRIVAQHRVVLVVEEHQLSGGFGAAVLELCEEHGVAQGHVRRLGIPDRFVEQAPRPRQLESLGLVPAAIAARVRRELGTTRLDSDASHPHSAGSRP
ncbi:MAG TPA: transketolase C-terminal domain-containing protein, partial [Gemmatimonadaceae bacterium]|nr:transketolase C-terminal domain-containing protein [Gemmatimonadaceae bacterium]